MANKDLGPRHFLTLLDLSSVELAVSGGAALPEEVHRRFQEQFGISILEGYGLTEASPALSFNGFQPGGAMLGSRVEGINTSM